MNKIHYHPNNYIKSLVVSLKNKYRRKAHPEWQPIVKVKLVLKNSKIEVEPPWSTISKSFVEVAKNAQNATADVILWGFYHLNVIKYIIYCYNTIFF